VLNSYREEYVNMSAKVRPLGEHILVEQAKEEERSSGGIVLPDVAKEKPCEGKVLAVGSGRLLDTGERAPIETKVGDTVIYSRYGGTEIKIDSKEYVILSEKDVLAIK
jgi:chaperonin GroES